MIVDTGSGYDIVGRISVGAYGSKFVLANSTLEIHTASDTTVTDKKIAIKVPGLEKGP